jgi:hypothetical protein
MLDKELRPRMKHAALDAPNGLDMEKVRRRGRSLQWLRRGSALGLAVVLVASGGAIAARVFPLNHVNQLPPGQDYRNYTRLPSYWDLKPPGQVKPKLSRREAIAVAAGPNGRGDVVHVAFGIFTDHDAFRVGSGELVWRDIPAWVVTLKGVPVCSEGGPLVASGLPAPTSQPCTLGVAFVVIRDLTGKRIQELQRSLPADAHP